MKSLNPNQQIGSWLQLGSTEIFSIFSKFNFNFQVIDIEHGSHKNIEEFPKLKNLTSKLYVRTKSRDKNFYAWLLDFDLGQI